MFNFLIRIKKYYYAEKIEFTYLILRSDQLTFKPVYLGKFLIKFPMLHNLYTKINDALIYTTI